MSDTWEEINGRDPSDGKLLFTFDCGGWQTEGWRGNAELDNIAGRQGFLDFKLANGKGTLTRSGLNLDTSKNQGNIEIAARCDVETTIRMFAKSTNGEAKVVGQWKLSPSQDIREASIPSGNAWSGTIESISLEFESSGNAMIEMDQIAIP